MLLCFAAGVIVRKPWWKGFKSSGKLKEGAGGAFRCRGHALLAEGDAPTERRE